MISHKGSKTIKTERLKLRKVNIDDAKKLFEIWYSDEIATKFMAWQPHKNIDETIESTKNWIEKSKQKEIYHWIVESEHNEVIGAVDVFYINDKDEKAEIGYCFGRDYWGRGYASEAVIAVLKFMFIEVGLNRIEAYHSVENVGSGRVLKKVGMQFEGHFRQYYKTLNGFEDCDMYAVLKSDIIDI